MERWQRKWMAQHPDASLQEFAVALSQRMTRTFVFVIAAQIVVFIAVLPIASVI